MQAGHAHRDEREGAARVDRHAEGLLNRAAAPTPLEKPPEPLPATVVVTPVRGGARGGGDGGGAL